MKKTVTAREMVAELMEVVRQFEGDFSVRMIATHWKGDRGDKRRYVRIALNHAVAQGLVEKSARWRECQAYALVDQEKRARREALARELASVAGRLGGKVFGDRVILELEEAKALVRLLDGKSRSRR